MSAASADSTTDLTTAPFAPTLHKPRRGLIRQSLAFRRTQIGLALTGLIVGIALFGPWLAPHTTTEFLGAPFTSPTTEAWFGTDALGRDVLTRFLSGGRLILAESLVATVIGIGLGTMLGVLAGYARGFMDDVIMRALDVLLAFPSIVLALLAISIVGPEPWLVVLSVALIHLPRTARVARGATVEVAQRDYVRAAEARGGSRWQIIVREIMPNISSPMLVQIGLSFTWSIEIIASLNFLGMGVNPPAADWGLMISENRVGLEVQPWGVILPIAAIATLTIGTSLVADGLSRALVGIERSGDDE